MAIIKNDIRLTLIARQLLMHEMFRDCIMIDYNVINQYFPFVKSNDRRLRFPPNVQRLIMRDFKDLREAGVIAYQYNEKEEYFVSLPYNFKLNIPENTGKFKKNHLERLNHLCRFTDRIYEIEIEAIENEDKKELELDDAVFNYKIYFENEILRDSRPLTDIDLYRYDDPFVAEYVKLKGETSITELKEDFRLLQELGYLFYSITKNRFYVPYDVLLQNIRQDYGISKSEDGKLYIRS